MSEDTTTTTEQETVQALETTQPESPETQAVQVDEESTDTTNQTEGASEQDEILEWASKKGVDVENVDKTTLLKMVRESEKQMHNATKQAKELQNTVNTIGDEQGFDETSLVLNRLKVTEFYLNNQDARSLDNEMAEIVRSKPYLADDLDTVYELARARKQPVSQIEAKQQGHKEALAAVAKAEQAGPPQTSATTRAVKNGVSEDDIAKMSTTEYLEFKKETGYNPFKA